MSEHYYAITDFQFNEISFSVGEISAESGIELPKWQRNNGTPWFTRYNRDTSAIEAVLTGNIIVAIIYAEAEAGGLSWYNWSHVNWEQ